MIDNIILTAEGKKKLEEELLQLKNVKRKEISERIELAKEHGDLSENAEYQEARNEQSFIEGRILEIENTLKNATLAEVGGRGQINIGSKVRLVSSGKEMDFSIVGSHEGDPILGLLSCDSPLGDAILGKQVGESVEIKTPKGQIVYKILSIN